MIHKIKNLSTLAISAIIFSGVVVPFGEAKAFSKCDQFISDFKDMQLAESSIQESLISNHDMMIDSFDSFADALKETSGKSPKDWIIDYSLLEIKELLKNSSLNIQEITIRTKFLNQSALGRFFKRHTNMSPSEYRESTY